MLFGFFLLRSDLLFFRGHVRTPGPLHYFARKTIIAGFRFQNMETGRPEGPREQSNTHDAGLLSIGYTRLQLLES